MSTNPQVGGQIDGSSRFGPTCTSKISTVFEDIRQVRQFVVALRSRRRSAGRRARPSDSSCGSSYVLDNSVDCSKSPTEPCTIRPWNRLSVT
jgi:hypothetical protein